jgi:hypothetical protein
MLVNPLIIIIKKIPLMYKWTNLMKLVKILIKEDLVLEAKKVF